MNFIYLAQNKKGYATANISIPELITQIKDDDFHTAFDIGILLNRFLKYPSIASI